MRDLSRIVKRSKHVTTWTTELAALLPATIKTSYHQNAQELWRACDKVFLNDIRGPTPIIKFLATRQWLMNTQRHSNEVQRAWENVCRTNEDDTTATVAEWRDFTIERLETLRDLIAAALLPHQTPTHELLAELFTFVMPVNPDAFHRAQGQFIDKALVINARLNASRSECSRSWKRLFHRAFYGAVARNTTLWPAVARHITVPETLDPWDTELMSRIKTDLVNLDATHKQTAGEKKRAGESKEHKDPKEPKKDSNGKNQKKREAADAGSAGESKERKYHYDPKKYCDHHQRRGHSTEECKFLNDQKAAATALAQQVGASLPAPAAAGPPQGSAPAAGAPRPASSLAEQKVKVIGTKPGFQPKK